ncbi:MAG: hypothetical protein ACI93R_000808 [Flavobacteriales bacterium]|jgi:hypothetical protein
MQGTLKKMRATLDQDGKVNYTLPIGDNELDLNSYIGKTLSLTHTGNIFCSNCEKKTKKSYAQGHCYVCMTKLASCDMCIMKPETCHYQHGTCREPEWGEKNCFIPHYVYLSNTSGVKVGITRHTQIPTRWIDQGATQGLIIFEVKSRLVSGLVEVALAKLVADKTHWQAMLKGNADNVDLTEKAEQLIPLIEAELKEITATHGDDAIERVHNDIQTIQFPISEFPSKVKSHNFDKTPLVSGILQGIKGQYLIFDTGVINIRKFGSYEVSV